MDHFGKRVVYDGYTFDSAKERDFYVKFIKPSGLRFEVHPNFKIIDKFMVGGTYVRGVWYKPDFVVYDHDGEIKHVYDVKPSVDSQGTDTAAKLRFKLFEKRYRIPVEVIVPRKHDFKMTILGITDLSLLDKHVKRDRQGREKQTAARNYQFGYHNVYTDINYSVWDIIGK